MFLSRFLECFCIEAVVSSIDYHVAFSTPDATRILNRSLLFRVGQHETSWSYPPNRPREFDQILLDCGSPIHASTPTAFLSIGFG